MTKVEYLLALEFLKDEMKEGEERGVKYFF